MKFLVTSCIVLFSSMDAQGMFPVAAGNLWQYASSDVMHPEYIALLITDSLTMPNGKTYAHFSNFPFRTTYLRQQDSIVYAYFASDSSERVLFNFAALAGDTVSRFPAGLTFPNETRIILQERGVDTIFHRQRWMFIFDVGYTFWSWTLIDSLGITNIFVEPGYWYHATGIRINGVVKYGFITSVRNDTRFGSPDFVLSQNYPNPFNPSTTIEFSVARGARVRLSIYDLLGQELSVLRDGYCPPGTYEVNWTASREASGLYFYRIQTGDASVTRSMLLLR